MPVPNCPECDCPLRPVEQADHGMLNDEQFASIRAGDWYCNKCTGPRGKSGHRYYWNRELTGEIADILSKPDPSPDGFKDCQFCNDEVTDTDVFRHNGGRLYHVDCLIRLLLDTIHDLQNPLTGEVEDDSILNAFKKIRSALREQSRINNKIAYERPLSNSFYGTDRNPKCGMYKNKIGVTWGDVQDLASKAVRDAVTELESLT